MNKLVAVLLVVGFAYAQEESPKAKAFKVAEGSVTGTYSNAFVELAENCSTPDLPLIKIAGPTDGATNLDAVINGQAAAGFVRADIIHLRGMTEDLTHVKTLFPLWPEQVHVLALSTSKVMQEVEVSGKLWGHNKAKQPIVLNTVTDLKNLKLGAAGANKSTAMLIKIQSGIDYEIVQYNNAKEAKAALDNGDVAALLFTAGAPLPNLVDLGSQYKLLPFPESVQNKLSQVYTKARVSYPKMSTDSIATVASRAIFVTRTFRTSERINQLALLRACFFKRIDELKDEGKNPQWQQIDENNRGSWAWYELPEVAKSAVVPVKMPSSSKKK